MPERFVHVQAWFLFGLSGSERPDMQHHRHRDPGIKIIIAQAMRGAASDPDATK